jgi:hypothetical protein
MGKPQDEWALRSTLKAGLKNAALVLDETFLYARHQPPDAGTSYVLYLLAERKRFFVHMGTQSTVPDLGRSWPLVKLWIRARLFLISEYTGGGFGSKGYRLRLRDYSRAAF